tara:strand:+ start:2243 stop:3031 length:789 start_codon:yes stop_codon:yes gene_type:complete
MQGLMLHCGAHHVTSDDVCNSRAKEPKSDTYVPIEHGEFLNRVVEVLDNFGYEIKEEAHALMKDEQRYFGLLDVRKTNGYNKPDSSRTIGLRNGHDGQMPAAMVGGRHTFVCDNLCFSGDMVKVQRKHTRNIHRDIDSVIARGIAQLDEYFDVDDQRESWYKETKITNRRDINDLLITAMKHGALLPTQIPYVDQEWERSISGVGPGKHESLAGNSFYSLLNCFTEVEKKKPSPAESPKRNMRLTKLLDATSGFQQELNLMR